MNYIAGHRSVEAVLLGLNDELAEQLLTPLAHWCAAVRRVSGLSGVPRASDDVAGESVIFCGPDAALVSDLRRQLPEKPIVVVTRHSDTLGWLDAIEAGADDYCAAPFEDVQMKWILQSTVRQRLSSAL